MKKDAFSITGGKFTGSKGICEKSSAVGYQNITVKGGTFTGAEAVLYVPGYCVADAGNSGPTIILSEDVRTYETIEIKGSLVIDGNNHEIKSYAEKVFDIGAYNINVKMNDLKRTQVRME